MKKAEWKSPKRIKDKVKRIIWYVDNVLTKKL